MENTDRPDIVPALEAILFAAGDSVPALRIAKVLDVEEDEVYKAASILADDYAFRRSGIRLIVLEDSLQLCSASEYSDVIVRTLEKRKPAKLSPTALEVLGIVAYYQPVTRAFIEQMRGVDSSYTVSILQQRGLIETCGKLDAPGRPTLFRTGENFLRVMGIRSLDELPPLPDASTDEGMEQIRAVLEGTKPTGQIQMEDVS